MKKISPVFSMIMTVLILFVSAASAEIREKTFSVTPFIGGYTFEGNEDLATRPVYGLRLGYDFTRNWGLEGAFDYVKTDFSRNNISSDVNVYGYRLEGLYNFMPGGKLVPFLAVGFGGRSTGYKDVPNDRNQFLGDYGAGVKYFLSDNLALRGDIRHLILNKDRYNNLEYTIGLTYYFGKPRTMQTLASQPAEPTPPPATQPAKPILPPSLAVPINLTATPGSDSQINLGWNAVDGATGYKIYRDGPYLASSATANAPDRGLKPSTRYCYKVTATDKAGRESDQSNEACAATPAPPVMVEQKKEAAVAVAKEMFEKGRATIDIEFDFDKADIKSKYHQEIQKFADVMKNYPDLKVVIEGHTDNIGSKAYNEKLSQRRAENVKKYMMDKFGINADRLSAKGYGMSKPVTSNKTSAGRAKNRRVEAAVDFMIKK